MRLLDFIKQYDAVWFTTHTFGQLSAFVVTDISRRRSDEAADIKLLHVLAHIDANNCLLVTEQVFGKNICELCLSHAGRSEEDETPDRTIRILEAGAAASDGFDQLLNSLILTYNTLLEKVTHFEQTLALTAGDTVYRNACYHAHNGRYIFSSRLDFLVGFIALPLLAGCCKIILKFTLFITKLGSFFVFLLLDQIVFFALQLFNLGFQLEDTFGHNQVLQSQTATGFIENVDGLVRQKAVRDVSVRQKYRLAQTLFIEQDAVVVFVIFLQSFQNLNGFIRARWINQQLLEATFEGAIFLNVLTIFVQRRRPDALQLTARQSWFEHIGSVQASRCRASPYDGVQLVNEDDHVWVFLDFGEDRFHSLLKLATIFGTSDH
ncbi:hypothetical protein BMS3Bbin04_01351 [bacterium BMS3Bbin04]|nr:hypothetical protein BMS3Bbin04_01351 [bacterium BMS3Bbin04]